MKILLQKNIWNEYGYDVFCQALVDADIECQLVGVIPFTDEFTEHIDFVPDLVFGSGRFVNICRSKNFPTFPSFGPIEPNLIPLHHWINGEGHSVKWKDIKINSPKFIKPFTEKFFTGLLVESQEDLDKVQLATSFIENEDDELVWIADPKAIKIEVRFFVLYGEIVTGSIYKINGVGNHQALNYDHPAWKACQDILSDWEREDCSLKICRPDTIDGFVIDLGLVDNEWKVVELNNLNSAGFYRCDTDAIVRRIKLFSK